LTGRPVTVYPVPVPVYVVPPGDLVIVQVPDDGSPLKTTLPDVVIHVGWVMVPTTGAVGFALTVNGKVLLHPSLVLVYVKVTGPADTPETTPALVIVAMAVLLLVHVPAVAGVTLAVEPIQTELAPPVTGFVGIVLMTTFADDVETHELLLVTVKV
jgi:hypothetical protein